MKEKNLKEVFDDLEKDPEIARQFEYFGALTRLVLEVEEERLYKNISQEELANRMGTKQEAISRFESLRHKPGYDFLARLSKALGGRLSITTNGDYAFVVPNKYRSIIDKCAREKGEKTEDFIEDLFLKVIKDLQPPEIQQKQKKFYNKPIKENLTINNNDKENAFKITNDFVTEFAA